MDPSTPKRDKEMRDRDAEAAQNLSRPTPPAATSPDEVEVDLAEFHVLPDQSLLSSPDTRGLANALEGVAQALEVQKLSEDLVNRAVAFARLEGATWVQIGQLLGTTRSAAHSRFGKDRDDRLSEQLAGNLALLHLVKKWIAIRDIVSEQPMMAYPPAVDDQRYPKPTDGSSAADEGTIEVDPRQIRKLRNALAHSATIDAETTGYWLQLAAHLESDRGANAVVQTAQPRHRHMPQQTPEVHTMPDGSVVVSGFKIQIQKLAIDPNSVEERVVALENQLQQLLQGRGETATEE